MHSPLSLSLSPVPSPLQMDRAFQPDLLFAFVKKDLALAAVHSLGAGTHGESVLRSFMRGSDACGGPPTSPHCTMPFEAFAEAFSHKPTVATLGEGEEMAFAALGPDGGFDLRAVRFRPPRDLAEGQVRMQVRVLSI
jgi:hypothetical protein